MKDFKIFIMGATKEQARNRAIEKEKSEHAKKSTTQQTLNLDKRHTIVS